MNQYHQVIADLANSRTIELQKLVPLLEEMVKEAEEIARSTSPKE